MGELRDIIGPYLAAIDPHLPPFNAKGDLIYGRDGKVEGNRLFVPGYTFKPEDVGKSLYVDYFGTGSRLITDIGGLGDPNACTFGGAAVAEGTGRAYYFGTDDTAALQKALDAARYSRAGYYVGDNVQGLRADVRGRAVKLKSGAAYSVRNTAAAFGAGKTAALYGHRRTAFVGEDAAATSAVLPTPDSYGDTFSNADARLAMANNSTPGAYVDFLTIGNLTLNGQRGFGGQNGKTGLFLNPSYNGYLDTDPCNTVFNVISEHNIEHNFWFRGRGELLAWGLRGPDAGKYGMYVDGLVDSSISDSSFGGNRLTGFRVNRSANCRFDNIKSWYSGASGGTDEKNCANFVFEADQANNGKCLATMLDSQESRGSGFVIDNSGYSVFRACRAQDPGQQAGALGATPLPLIRAGVRLMGTGCVENDLDFRVEPGVRAFATPNFTGSSALAIDEKAARNFGKVEAQLDMQYADRGATPDGAIIEGVGVSNGKNRRIMVGGVALT